MRIIGSVMNNPNTRRDLVIIGSGPAAWTAAIYAARSLLYPLVIAGDTPGGQLMTTTEVENFPGFEQGILGPTLMEAMRKQAERVGVVTAIGDVTMITEEKHNFMIKTTSSSPIVTRAVIVASGATANTLKLPGEDRLMGRGVGTCAVCDAPFYRGKDTVFVVGGGDSAMEEARALAKFARRVIIIVRSDKLKASQIMINHIKEIQNIEIWFKSQATDLFGDKKLERVRVERDGASSVYPADGLFYAIGHTPSTAFLKESGILLDEMGYIITPISSIFSPSARARTWISKRFSSETTREEYSTITSVSGIFAAGDCTDPTFRQAVTAAGMGCMAALDAQRWLERHSHSS